MGFLCFKVAYRCRNVAQIKQIHCMSDFHRHEVVGRGSETQLQVGENVLFLQ